MNADSNHWYKPCYVYCSWFTDLLQEYFYENCKAYDERKPVYDGRKPSKEEVNTSSEQEIKLIPYAHSGSNVIITELIIRLLLQVIIM